MRFSRLRLNGFKSFVDPTDLVIADGLTGVVGPNGCGKSNLLEALRWVMGENRPTAMRGGGMEDVIFAGAASRPARHFAEVTLALDNSDRTAPAAFNHLDRMEVVRRITRDAGSAYKLDGGDVRARDVQMLFADASTGAHSPALVRQGQIAELIGARPQKRRRILEEAAGISGLYQRRHEAELKLGGAEANLGRVDDVVGQLGARMASLARQARQAARYREIGAALRQAEGMLLWRRWHEAETARAAAEATLRARLGEAAASERRAEAAGAARDAAERALPALREEETVAAAVLQRLSVRQDALADRERRARAEIGELEARVAQLGTDLAREQTLNRDAAGAIAGLEREENRLATSVAGHPEALAAAQGTAREAETLLGAREEELATLTEELARLSARHQSVTRAAEDAGKRLARVEAETARAVAEAAEACAARERADAQAAEAADAQGEAQAAAAEAEAALGAAEAARAAAQAAEDHARTARAEAEGAARVLAAEVTALDRLLTRATGEGPALLDRLTVVPGYEAALGAALGDDLRAPVAETGEEATGWAELPPYDAPPALPDGVEAVAAHVEGPALMARRLGQIGIVEGAGAADLQRRLRPGQVLVSRQGDLWRWDGFRAAAGAAPSAAAMRLQQVNRLAALRRELETAERHAAERVAAHETLARAQDRRKMQEAAAREKLRAADRALTEAGRALARAEGAQGMAGGRLEVARRAVARGEGEGADARAARREAEAARRALAPLDAARPALETLRQTVEGARMAMLTHRAAADELRREGEARIARARQVAKDLGRWRLRLAEAGTRLGDLVRRRDGAEGDLARARDMPASLAAQRGTLAQDIARAETRRTAAAAALSKAETTLRETVQAARDAERAAGEAREARAGAEARLDGARATLAAAEARIADALDTTPVRLAETLGAGPEEMPPVAETERRVEALRRQRDALGAVNLRAEADALEVAAEHDLLAAEKADLDQAIAELRAGIAALNREGRQRLLDAFDAVNANFAALFRHLFQGGEARLELIESDDPLEAGLEIMCQPPGKKLSALSLLSGGEQTLTALALIFAVFLANPAPICVLDEVDAPLDDANVARFCDMLDEMTRRTSTRFLVITHHAVTMARMDRLYGVTMVEQGVSQLVSVDLRKAEALVA